MLEMSKNKEMMEWIDWWSINSKKYDENGINSLQ